MYAEANVGLARVGPGEPADLAGVRTTRDIQIPGDLGAVHMVGDCEDEPKGHEPAVVEVVHVPPERAVLAPPVVAEVRPRAVVFDDKSAAGDEVTRTWDFPGVGDYSVEWP